MVPSPTHMKCDCGHAEKFPMYVHAHWSEYLSWTCPICGREYSLHRGDATLIHAPHREKD